MSSRLDILDLLRGIAAISVALYHFTGGMADSGFKEVCSYGRLGVDIFFVISGFIIPYSLARASYRLRTDYGRFLAKRVLRLHPAFLASIVLAVGLWYLSSVLPGFRGEPPDFSALRLVSNPFLITAILGQSWLQPVYWTLAIEFQFYLFVGLIFPLLASTRPLVTWLALGAILALAFLPVRSCWLLPYLPLFVLGMLVFQHAQGRFPNSVLLTALAATSGAVTLTLGPIQATAGFLTAVLIAFSRFTLPRALAWPGLVSYSLYLVHVPIGARLVNFSKRLGLDAVGYQIPITAIALGASLIAAHAFFHWFEAPSQRASSALRFKRA